MDAPLHAPDRVGQPSAGGRGCWVDLFELSHFRGRRRRVFGPTELRSIRSRFAAWGIGIDSLIVGPSAQVQMYSAQDIDPPAKVFMPNQVVEDLVALGVGDEWDSIRVLHAPTALTVTPASSV
jgi:hypothetical protein